jgi:hypothetical protein
MFFKLGVAILGTCYECKGGCLRCVGLVWKDVEDVR